MSQLNDRLAHESRLRITRHVAAMGGRVTASYFGDITENRPVRDAMLADRHLTAGKRDRITTYELTDAGRRWLAAMED